MKAFRTHNTSDLNKTIAGQTVILAGWLQRLRDHGGLLFFDVRDRSGLCQVVVPPDLAALAKSLHSESVVSVEGVVTARPAGMVNAKMASGEIELHAKTLTVLSKSQVVPFSPEADTDQVNENTRLKYRYLDLRRPQLQKNFVMRHKILQSTRRYFDEHGFLEIETPILYKSTPEGARDYLVPSRVHPGEFFALPQSPQTLKQLLMIAGIERYCQIARCFRDEDLRADRQPEFTQIDLEVSFMTRDEFLSLLEGFVKTLWKTCLGVDLKTPFQRLRYDDAMARFGSDKPDLRFGLELGDVSAALAKSEFKVFSSTLAAGGKVVGLAVKADELKAAGIAHPEWSRKFFDGLSTVVAPFGMKGVLWAKVEALGTWNSPAAKFLKPDEIAAIEKTLGLKAGDYAFFAAERAPRVLEALGALRLHLGKELGLIKASDTSRWEFAWIMDFPLFVQDESEGRLYAAHHPFTRPLDADTHKMNSTDKDELLSIRAEAYDLALNGFELGGGSFRIYQPEMQSAMFRALGMSDEQAKSKFGYFIEALQYGTPPHGGLALGVDRIAMLMTGSESLREVIAFPKTARAVCLMSESPSSVSPDQLAELRLQILKT
jgi:aspartyl-tRNA synthetase